MSVRQYLDCQTFHKIFIIYFTIIAEYKLLGVMLQRSSNHFENGTATVRSKTFDAGPLSKGMCVELEVMVT